MAAACNSSFLMWLSDCNSRRWQDVTGCDGVLGRWGNHTLSQPSPKQPRLSAVYKATRCNSWPSKRLPWGHCLSASPGSPWQAPAMASKVVHTGHLKWQAPTCFPFHGEKWHSEVKKAKISLNWYALSWSETSHVQRECVERFPWRLPVSNCANRHSSNLRSCESI